ncbi:restriction endonuclease [Niallia sp. FSL R7-0271]|uniref:restriction endonuclease n=1 Tax=Niallia sp. FSL R7-0271 TaxID=2921678 RepID=UPI0030FC1E14
MGSTYKKKSKGIAYLLWLFLGLLGGHRFYMGDYGKGVAMALTCGGFMFWWASDFFSISRRVYTKNIELQRLEQNRRAEEFRLENLRRQEEIKLQNQIRQDSIRLHHEEMRLWNLKKAEEIRLESLRKEEEIKLQNQLREQRIRESGIFQIDEMSGEDFEDFLYVLYKDQGYNVKKTPTTGDYGADLILTKNNRKIAVQAKRYKDKVGVSAIQEIYSAKGYYDADECWVVTNSMYTENAVKLAASNGVVLIDRNKLIGYLVEKNQGA